MPEDNNNALLAELALVGQQLTLDDGQTIDTVAATLDDLNSAARAADTAGNEALGAHLNHLATGMLAGIAAVTVGDFLDLNPEPVTDPVYVADMDRPNVFASLVPAGMREEALLIAAEITREATERNRAILERGMVLFVQANDIADEAGESAKAAGITNTDALDGAFHLIMDLCGGGALHTALFELHDLTDVDGATAK